MESIFRVIAMKQLVRSVLEALGLTQPRPAETRQDAAVPGAWLQKDRRTQRWCAHVLLTFEPGAEWADRSFAEHLYSRLAGCVVRLGLHSRPLAEADLQPWQAGRNASELHATLAQRQAQFAGTVQKLRRIDHYLWVSQQVPDGSALELQALWALAARVEHALPGGASHYHPVADPQAFVQAFLDLQGASDSSGGSWTSALSLDEGAHAPLSGLVQACGEKLHGEFFVWSRYTLFADARKCQALRRGCAQLARAYGQARRDRFVDLAFACDKGEAGEGSVQVSLLTPEQVAHDRAELLSLAYREGYRMESAARSWPRWRAPHGRAPLTLNEASLLVPLGMPVAVPSLPSSGTLLSAPGARVMAFDPFDSQGNHNVLLLGSAGSGKSVAANALLLSHLASGGAGWAIACDADFAMLTDTANGTLVPMSAESHGLNPLGQCKTLDELLGLRDWVASLLPNTRSLLEGRSGHCIEEALVRAWRQRPACLELGHVQTALLEADDATSLVIAEGLAPYVGSGPLAKLFSGTPLTVTTAGLQVFSLADLPAEAAQPVSLTLMQLVCQHWQKMAGAERKMLVVASADAWPTQPNPSVAHLVTRLLRQARPCGGALVWPLHCMARESWEVPGSWPQAVQEHCSHLMLFKSHPECFEQAHVFGLDKAMAEHWRGLHTSRQSGADLILIRAGLPALPCRLPLEPLTLALAGTWLPRFVAYREARNRGAAVLSALQEAADAG